MILRIDGGGTRCRARLVDTQGAMLGERLGDSADVGLGVPARFPPWIGRSLSNQCAEPKGGAMDVAILPARRTAAL